jgi:AraC family transcriptional regulator of arabinose operon
MEVFFMAYVISGGIIKCEEGARKTRYVSPNNYIFFVLSGKGHCGKQRIQKGAGFFVRKNAYVDYTPSADAALTLAYFSIGQMDDSHALMSGDSDSARSFIVIDEEFALKIVSSLLPAGEYKSLGESFDAAAAELLLSLVSVSKNATVKPRSGKQYVDAAIKIIDDNYNRELKVENIAEELCIDRKYLRNLFSQHLGMSTMDYIMKVRMDRARDLLSNSDVSVTLVANSVGYGDVLAFSKAFKRACGCSPTEFRAANANIPVPVAEEPAKPTKKREVPVFIL